MNRFRNRALWFSAGVACLAISVMAADSSPALKAKLQAKAKGIQWMSTDPKVVAAVREHNANPSAEAKTMTQEKWTSLPVLDPFVRGLSKNALAKYLKTKRDPIVTELFVREPTGRRWRCSTRRRTGPIRVSRSMKSP